MFDKDKAAQIRMLSVFIALMNSNLSAAELLVHGPAVSLILIGQRHFVHVDPDRGQDATQLLRGLLGQGGLSAQDPGQLSAEGAELGAAVDQRVTLVVCGKHPVGTWRRGCGGDWEGEREGRVVRLRVNFQNHCKNQSFTFVEGDLQLGGLSGVLHRSRAHDGRHVSIVAKIRVSTRFKSSILETNVL